MNDFHFIELSSTETKELKELFAPKIFTHDTDIIYHDHVPMAFYALISGHFHLKDKNNKILKSFSKNTIIGFQEHAMREKFQYSLQVTAGSLVSVINAETIKEVIKNNMILKEKFSLNYLQTSPD